MLIGKKYFKKKPALPYIVGILNVSPDSFSDGRLRSTEEIVAHARRLEEEGASVIDIGAESTRPEATVLSEEEELKRLLPALKAVKEAVSVPLSVDTYKPAVAEAAINAGADMINDVHGLKNPDGSDSGMAAVVAAGRVSIVITHNDFLPRDPAGRDENKVVSRVLDGLKQSMDAALAAGVDEEGIILDPGLGFAKSSREDLLIMHYLTRFQDLNRPLYLGASRKSFIGNALSLPVAEREEGTMVCSVMAAMSGVSFVRVHDVEKNRRAIDMLGEIIYADNY